MAFSIKENDKPVKPTIFNKGKYFCSHCKMTGHSLERCYKANPNAPVYSRCNKLGNTVETCYKLKGQTKGERQQSRTRQVNVNQVSTNESVEWQSENEPPSLTKEQYNQLMSLIQQNRPTVNMVHSTDESSQDPNMTAFIDKLLKSTVVWERFS